MLQNLKKIAAVYIVGLLLIPASVSAENATEVLPDNPMATIEIDLKQENFLQKWIVEKYGQELAKEMSNAINPEITELMQDLLKGGKVTFWVAEITANETGLEEPKTFVTLSINDEQWSKLLELTKSSTFNGQYKDFTVYRNQENAMLATMHFTKKGNMLIMSEKEETLQKGIDAIIENKTLANNPIYQEAVRHFVQNQFAGVFGDNEKLAGIAEQLVGQISAISGTPTDTQSIKKVVDILKSGISTTFSMTEKENGLELFTHEIFDPEKRKAAGMDMKELSYIPKLYKKSPTKNPILYFEGANLKKNWDLQEGAGMRQIPDYEELTEKLKTETGLDFEKDIIGLFDGEFIFTMGAQKNPIPATTLLVDIKNNPETAKKLIQIMADSLEESLKDAGKDTIYTMEKTKIADGEMGYKFTINAPEDYKKENLEVAAITPIVLSFGLTGDMIMFASTDENFTSNYGSGITENSILETVKEDEQVTGRFYFGFQNLKNYFEYVFDAVYKHIDEKDQKYFEIKTLKEKTDDVFAPWDDIVMHSKTGEKETSSTIFIHVKIDDLNESYVETAGAWFQELQKNYRKLNIYKQDFTDIQRGAWYQSDLKEMRMDGIINGYSDKTFRPSNNVTRAEFLAMTMRTLYGSNNFYAINQTNLPTDVYYDDWFYNTVSKALEDKLVKGYTDGSFRPNNPITRAEAAQILHKIIEERLKDLKNSKPEERYSDISEKDWYFKGVYNVQNYGIMKGRSNGIFAPNEQLSRAEAAVLAKRLKMALDDGSNISK